MENVPNELVNLDKEISRQNTKSVSWFLLAHVMSYFKKEMRSGRTSQSTSRVWREYRNSELTELENKSVSHFQPFQVTKYFQIRIQPGNND